ncbi:MAG: LLM class flavin-dependent oxidoreductase [Candidatus Rokubacteria bacterium]|nr:LLM class flavin-dependent oxidoreductase [Candidatus Rokubacteria bacterium]
MKFGIQQLLSIRDWQTHAEVYADCLAEARLAEDVGFDAVWLAEHHFSAYGLCPSLAVLAGAIARETRRVRIGTAVVVAPFAHPIRVAEEWAMVDILSNGRLEFGLGRGYQPKEFAGLGVSMERTRERFDECLAIICQAWTQERMRFDGEFYKIPEIAVFPKPVQKPHPPLWTAAVSPDTYTLAARRGFKLLTSPAFTPWDIPRKNYDGYRDEWRRAHGTDAGAEIIMNKIIHVAETSKQARADVVEPIQWFFRTQADLIADTEGVPPEQYKFYRRVRENLLSLTEEQAVDQAAIVGDPEEVADKIRAHHEALGVSYFLGAFSRGGIPNEKVLKSLRLFGEKVIPRLG